MQSVEKQAHRHQHNNAYQLLYFKSVCIMPLGRKSLHRLHKEHSATKMDNNPFRYDYDFTFSVARCFLFSGSTPKQQSGWRA